MALGKRVVIQLLIAAASASAFTVYHDPIGSSTSHSLRPSNKKILQVASIRAFDTVLTAPHNSSPGTRVRTYDVSMNGIFETGVDPAIASMILATSVLSALAIKDRIVYEEDVILASEEEVDTEPEPAPAPEPEPAPAPAPEPAPEPEPEVVLETNLAVEEKSSELSDKTTPSPEVQEDWLTFSIRSPGTNVSTDSVSAPGSISLETPEIQAEKISVAATLAEELERLNAFARDENDPVPNLKDMKSVAPPEENKKSSVVGKVVRKTIMPWKKF